jgi:hypothetical protein
VGIDNSCNLAAIDHLLLPLTPVKLLLDRASTAQVDAFFGTTAIDADLTALSGARGDVMTSLPWYVWLRPALFKNSTESYSKPKTQDLVVIGVVVIKSGPHAEAGYGETPR